MRSVAVLWLAMLAAAQQPTVIPVGYRVETIAVPAGIVLEVGGLSFARDGSLLICTRVGEVWRRRGEVWSLFARGLHEPLGLFADPESDAVFVVQRPELTKLIDADGDGRAERFETVCAAWGLSGNYHEYAYGLVRAADGGFFGTLNLAHAIDERSRVGLVGGDATMSRPVPWRGSLFRVAPDGSFEPWAFGLRSPAGIGIDAAGEVFFTDNQGDWIGTSTLQHVVRGGFYGHPSSLLDHPEFAGRDAATITREEFAPLRRLPTVHIPYGDLANSPGEPVFDTTDGKFGPFAGQVFIGDQTKSNVFRACLEKVDGEYQGCCFDFVAPLQSGVVRSRFARDGSLWLGQTARGWGSAGTMSYGLQRIAWDGKTAPREILTVSLLRDGFRLTFTQPIDIELLADASNFKVAHWDYLYRPQYGSPPQSVTEVDAIVPRPAADGMRVDLIVPNLVWPKVYRLALSATSGVTNRVAWYTLNRLRPGD